MGETDRWRFARPLGHRQPAGELVINDNARLAPDIKRMEAEVKLEREPWKDLENAPAPGATGATGLDAYMESVAGAGHGAGMHGGGDPKDKKKKKGKAYNPARMGAMGSSEMGMMPVWRCPAWPCRGCPCLERPHRAPRARKASSRRRSRGIGFQNPPQDRSASPPFEVLVPATGFESASSPASARTTRARFVPRSGSLAFHDQVDVPTVRGSAKDEPDPAGPWRTSISPQSIPPPATVPLRRGPSPPAQ